ncbi:MAG: citrate/2-methylcitrate synthase [Candidatus Methylomirabilota bacterium]
MAAGSDHREFLGRTEFKRGLEGAITNETRIGYIDGEKGWLVFRGYNIEDLAERSTFEETSFLIIFGRLPTRRELTRWTDRLIQARALPDYLLDALRRIHPETHPMATLRTAVSLLGCHDSKADAQDIANYERIGVQLTAQMATITAAILRLRHGKDPIPPDPELSHAANFLYMSTGKVPDEISARVMDANLVLHMDHGMNASTFTGMVIASSLSDMYSAIAGAIGSLKGPLHGGANEEVMKMLLEVGRPERADTWVEKAITEKRKIPGFGHRVYKAYDPRAKVLSRFSERITKLHGQERLYQTAKRIEELVIPALGGKGIFTNVDFYSGTIYYCMGFDYAMYTPIFMVGRIPGQVARILEYLPDNRIFRPRAAYVGDLNLTYTPTEERG